MVDIDYLKINCFSKYIPCEYKLKSGVVINIYPINVEDYIDFSNSYDILEFDKSRLNDENIIRMSQLEYLWEVHFNIPKVIDERNKITFGENELQKFKTVFKLCLKEDYVAIDKDNNGKYYVIVADKQEDDSYILKYTITNKEYLEICKIILFQNFYDYSDEYVNPDVLEQYNEYIRLKHKGDYVPSFEKIKIFVLSRYKCTIEEINKMPYRLFQQLLNEYIDMEQYFVGNMYKTAYKYDVKEEVEYPLYRKPKDKFEDLFISEQSLKDKL